MVANAKSDHALLMKSDAASKLEPFDPLSVDTSILNADCKYLEGWEWAGSGDIDMVNKELVRRIIHLVRLHVLLALHHPNSSFLH